MGKVAQQVNDQLARFIVKVSRGLTGQDERGGVLARALAMAPFVPMVRLPPGC